MMKRILFALVAVAMLAPSINLTAKSNKKKPATTVTVGPVTPANRPASDDKAPKSFADVITKDAVSSHGFITVHNVKGKYFFEIPDSILGRDLLIVTRITKAPVDNDKQKTGYPGDEVGEQVVRFELNSQNKVFLRDISYIEKSNDTLGLYMAVKNSNIQPILASFDVKAYHSAKSNPVIDVTDYIRGDKGVFNFDENLKKRMGVAGMVGETSYIDTLKVFPINLEISMVKTYNRAPATGMAAAFGAAPTTPLTYEINSSMVMLPSVPMQPRFFDPRVGYFAIDYTDFDSKPQGIEYRSMITRWRLEPKPEDVEKYKRGELVEPQNPIIIYIDPATPKKWVPYLIQGVNDWQTAFEQAGFKNAIIAKEAPTNDPAWSLEDARHSAIIYKPSDIANASGPHVSDPRTGEILETHINWYHNVMSLLHDWYQIQAGPNDPRARKADFDDELMGQLIRFVSSHEVGHTLGLRHNFGSSATVPVEKLRDKTWVEANGHTPSIMDYARFNYVAQPEDNISEAGLFPRIGIYDKWAIEWGYRWLPQFSTPEAEIPYMNKWIISKLAEDKRYTFGTETDRNDPRNQNEDLGDDAMLAGTYGIKNLQRIVPNILEWSSEPNKDYQNAKDLYNGIVSQYGRYMGHVVTNVGGIYSTPRTIEEPGKSMEFVPADIQKRAMDFLNLQLFATPTWLIDKPLVEKATIDPISAIGSTQSRIVDRLLSKATIDKLSRNEFYNGTQAFTPADMFAALRKGIWTELATGKTPDIYRRNLQKTYVKDLITLLDKSPGQQSGGSGSAMVIIGAGSTPVPSDASAIARGQLVELTRDLKRVGATSTGTTKYHYQNLAAVIDAALENK